MQVVYRARLWKSSRQLPLVVNICTRLALSYSYKVTNENVSAGERVTGCVAEVPF